MDQAFTSASTPAPASRQTLESVRTWGNWTIHENELVASTNLTAAQLPAWHAVRADAQTGGRGRFQRTWVSDPGGLWLSAVLPGSTEPDKQRMIPLAAGVAVCRALRRVGVQGLRLRWPNDVLVGKKKLAGLLIDQFAPPRAVVGIGINVTNDPERRDSSLKGQVERLASLADKIPTLSQLTEFVLAELESCWNALAAEGGETLLATLNPLWDAPRPVRIELESETIEGAFRGVDASGRLALQTEKGLLHVEPHEVRLLRDIEYS